MRAVALFVAFVAALSAAAPAGAQEASLDVRLADVAGVRQDAALAFYDTLRKAVGQDNRQAACGMVAYPLPHATGVVKDAPDCVARYESLFTIPVRRAIGKQRFAEVFVNEQGVMFGVGELWFAGRCAKKPCTDAADLRVTTINSQTEGLQLPKGKVLLACVVAGQKIRVAADGAGGASLSVWYAPDFSGAPGREFPRAEPAEPPASCGSRTWVFKDDVRTYTISELPCDAYLSPPPMGSVGRVTLSTPNQGGGEALWCRDLQD
ncbi:MAG: hypothetical protein U0P82_13160 [Vicinamibacterales bacterium]